MSGLKMKHRSLAIAGTALLILFTCGWVHPSQAGIALHTTADVRVWLDGDMDVYPGMEDAVFCIRPAIDCYALVFVVDTDGFVHVIYPFSPYDQLRLRGGMTYRFFAREAGLYSFDFDRGIAFVYAVASPFPFDYSAYDVGIYAGGYAYRIYGDPYIACKRFYVSLLPPNCNWAVIGVSFSCFYVREWVRYPRYLCFGDRGSHGWHAGYCSACEPIYAQYRLHRRDPYRVLSPRVRYKGDSSHAKIAPVPAEQRESLRVKRDRRLKAENPQRSLREKQVLYEQSGRAKNIAGNVEKAIQKGQQQHRIADRQSVQKTQHSKLSSARTVKQVAQGRSLVRSSKEIVKRDKSVADGMKQRTLEKKVSERKTSKARASADKRKEAKSR